MNQKLTTVDVNVNTFIIFKGFVNNQSLNTINRIKGGGI